MAPPKQTIRLTARDAARLAEQVFGVPQRAGQAAADPAPIEACSLVGSGGPEAETGPATCKPGLHVAGGAAASGAGSSRPHKSTDGGQG